MRRRRNASSGVTLIEMLLALAVSSMIGVAGFVLLEGMTRTEQGVTGALSRLSEQDRAFRLFSMDVAQAVGARFRDTGALELQQLDHLIVWSAEDQAVTRILAFEGRAPFPQQVLNQEAEFRMTRPGVVAFRLPQEDAWRLAPLPEATP
ncbi:hypothetical protein AIOL_004388 [Candidatus Rhodobacter oscarellae]|uniref:Prepilin-type N-terminal cleavage/methylation domain-containing protein n=1 Tax=Candidatus Rhodobacter oscarellae TaxID=1675527 RepID=A0A0J9E9U8_9RHOB|nr:prepilin-type N-terminal cleavage/methylation domain-containing protein [Candidatus Rhodobacter lobularis]KMW59406.1 hypothetical protein AIOL_004388 [Candidatus Rhodobacter lobularis]